MHGLYYSVSWCYTHQFIMRLVEFNGHRCSIMFLSTYYLRWQEGKLECILSSVNMQLARTLNNKCCHDLVFIIWCWLSKYYVLGCVVGIFLGVHMLLYFIRIECWNLLAFLQLCVDFFQPKMTPTFSLSGM